MMEALPPPPPPPSIAEVADRCFAQLEQHVAQHGTITVEQLAGLGLLLGRNWQKALAAVDGRQVACYVGERSGRRVFQVSGRAGASYVTLARAFCTCQAHHYEVVVKAEAAYCKHQLAARLALVLGRCEVAVVPDAALAEFLLQM